MTPETDEQRDRRDFLKSCGRFAAVTPPAMTMLLSTSLTSTAIAQSGGHSSGSGGGGNSNHKSFFDNDPGPAESSADSEVKGGSDDKKGAAQASADSEANPGGQSSASDGGDNSGQHKSAGQSDHKSVSDQAKGPAQPSAVSETKAEKPPGTQDSEHHSTLKVDLGRNQKEEMKLDPEDHISIVNNSGGLGRQYHVTSGDLGDEDNKRHKAKVSPNLQ